MQKRIKMKNINTGKSISDIITIGSYCGKTNVWLYDYWIHGIRHLGYGFDNEKLALDAAKDYIKSLLLTKINP